MGSCPPPPAPPCTDCGKHQCECQREIEKVDMKLPNIGLCGYMRSGKDTIADYLIEQYGYKRFGMADALKEEVARGVGCPPAELNQEPLRSQVRPVLQVWGTEFRRAQDSSYWVAQAEQKIFEHRRVCVCDKCGSTFTQPVEHHDRYAGRDEGPFECNGTAQPAGPIVFNDVRFHNEIDMLRAHRFLIIKVDMSIEDVLSYTEAHGEDRAVTLARLDHASEREWREADFDVVIPSVRGNIQGLYDSTKLVVEEGARGHFSS